MKLHALSLALLLFLPCADAAAAQPRLPVSLGEPVALSGPWRFRVGDDPPWADPGFDDSAWTMAWRAWFGVRTSWLPGAIAVLTLVLFVTQLLARPWLFHAAFPRVVAAGVHDLITTARLAFLLLFILLLRRLWSYAGRRTA